MIAARQRLILNGFGKVGQAFARLIVDRRASLAARYGVDLEVVAVATSSSVWQAGSTSSLEVLMETVGRGASLSDCSGAEQNVDGKWAIEHVAADLVVEATPTNLRDGEPGTTNLRMALSRGLHVVTAAKGPLLHHLDELRALAAKSGTQLRIGAATAAALPTVDLADYCLAGSEITRVEGILNGTSNFVLTDIAAGVSYERALARAQDIGIAEADPSLDVLGHDTAVKLVLIARWIWNVDLRLREVPVTGIVGISRADLDDAARAGARIKLIGAAWHDAFGTYARVGPTRLPLAHPLAFVDGAEKGATFTTDTLDRVTVIGGKSDPTGAAAALLRDVLHVTAGDRPREGLPPSGSPLTQARVL